MAKSGSWPRGVSTAVFLGELYCAGNGQHLELASMAKSGSWPRGVSAAVFLGEICGAGHGIRNKKSDPCGGRFFCRTLCIEESPTIRPNPLLVYGYTTQSNCVVSELCAALSHPKGLPTV
jgi:hypothetical protein